MLELRLTKGEGVVRARRFTQGPVRIGRDPDGEMALAEDAEISRRHARIDREGNTWTLSDEGSANGTFVNAERLAAGVPRPLVPGDVVTLGASRQSELVCAEVGDALVADLVLEGQGLRDGVRFASLLGSDDPRSIVRARDRLYVLYEASRAVFSRIQDIRELLDRIKEEVVRSLSVDEMIVALKDADGSLTFDVVNRRGRFRATEIAGSKTLISQVFESGRPVWLSPEQAGATGGTSFIRHNIRTVMCVPLVFRGDILGVIYVQNPEGGGAIFTPADFDFLSAFAAQAAIAIHAARGAEERNRLLEDMRRENVELRQGIDSRDPLAAIVGESPGIRAVKDLIRAVKDLPSTVLVQGESGTGKELVAKAIHFCGQRRDRPFVSVSVAAFAGGVLESELFGHEKGAFTGAVARKVGKFELAREGTLFLDEIGEVPLAMQVKFLRVLQERSFERVGGNQAIEVDVRLVSATHRDLLEATHEGTFREDLYYRVNVVPIFLPPLRERRSDIPLIAENLTQRLRLKLRLEVQGITDRALEALVAYNYPGNVRELENLLERAFIRLKIRGGDQVDIADLPMELRHAEPSLGARDQTLVPESYAGLRQIEREMVAMALERAGWNKRRAAQMLGITHQTLYARIEEFGLRKDES